LLDQLNWDLGTVENGTQSHIVDLFRVRVWRRAKEELSFFHHLFLHHIFTNGIFATLFATEMVLYHIKELRCPFFGAQLLLIRLFDFRYHIFTKDQMCFMQISRNIQHLSAKQSFYFHELLVLLLILEIGLRCGHLFWRRQSILTHQLEEAN
jgi:hypothetical protein